MAALGLDAYMYILCIVIVVQTAVRMIRRDLFKGWLRFSGTKLHLGLRVTARVADGHPQSSPAQIVLYHAPCYGNPAAGGLAPISQ